MKRFFSLILIFTVFTQALAETVVMDGPVNARSTTDFHSTENRVAVLSKGTEGTILAREEFPSGSYALQIKVTKLGVSPSNNLKVNSTVWIYYHKKPKVRYIEVFDDRGVKIDDPARSAWAKVVKTFKIQSNVTNPLPKPQTVECANCGLPERKPIIDEKEIQKRIDDIEKIQADKIPQVFAGEEELAKFIEDMNAKDKYKNNDNYATNLKIARSMIKYSQDFGVPLKLALAVAAYESAFRPKAQNPRSSAHGIMQILNGTELTEARELHLVDAKKRVPKNKRYDPDFNIAVGLHYLAKCVKDFPGDPDRQIAAYYLGQGGARDVFRGKKSKFPWRDYVAKVSSFMERFSVLSKLTGIT